MLLVCITPSLSHQLSLYSMTQMCVVLQVLSDLSDAMLDLELMFCYKCIIEILYL